ncbi:MAG: DUF4097 family beta strand repeat protein [bacterium]|nr:DUF4097 family beta strand repeat protein [Candidatus Limimorpha caballi]
MKKFLILTALSLMTFITIASNNRDGGRRYKFEEQKTVEQTFDVGALPQLEMKGVHSDFIITTWDEPQIDFKVKIVVKSDKEKTVKYLMDIININVEFFQECDLVKAKTVFENKTNRSFNASVSIKYYVKVPEDVRMDLETRYGDIIVETVKKDFKAEVKYGSLTAGNLLADNEIEIKYGGLNVEYAKNINLDMAYSDCKINKVEFIDAEISYSNFTATDIFRGVFENKYSDIRINKIKELKAEDKYSDLRAVLDTDKPNVDIDAEYSNIKLKINENASFRYDIRVSYGDIVCGEIMKSNVGRTSDGRIVGSRGDEPSGSIRAELEYGDFRIE